MEGNKTCPLTGRRKLRTPLTGGKKLMTPLIDTSNRRKEIEDTSNRRKEIEDTTNRRKEIEDTSNKESPTTLFTHSIKTNLSSHRWIISNGIRRQHLNNIKTFSITPGKNIFHIKVLKQKQNSFKVDLTLQGRLDPIHYPYLNGLSKLP